MAQMAPISAESLPIWRALRNVMTREQVKAECRYRHEERLGLLGVTDGVEPSVTQKQMAWNEAWDMREKCRIYLL